MTAPPARALVTSPPVEPPSPDVARSPSGKESGRATLPDSRARSFRERQAQRRVTRRERIWIGIVVGIIVLGSYTILTARPFSASSGKLPPSPGPVIVVQLGTPTVSTVNCTAGGTGYVERIPWLGSSQPVTTGDIFVRVFELWDGDYIPDNGAVANVTPTNVCAGSPPDGSTIWYAALAAPNATNQLSYTSKTSWVSVTGEPWNFPVQNGSSLVLVSYTSFAETGRGFGVGGIAHGSPIRGTVPL